MRNKRILKNRINETLFFFPDLQSKFNVPARNLSGGQQQMLALARALIANPKLLLLDEPLLGLSPKIIEEVVSKIKEINQKKGTTILIVEHNISSVLDISSRLYLLKQGKIIWEGSSKNVTKEDLIKKTFID